MHVSTTPAADGAPLAWSTWDSPGRPGLLVVHGGGRAAEHYAALAQALLPRFTVHAMDRRGRGRSGPVPAVASLAADLEDIERVLAATGATHLFGHSAGGRLALELACRRSFASLLLYEPPLVVPAGWQEAFVAAVRAGRRGEAMRRFLRGLQMAPKGPWPDWLLELGASFMLRGAAGDAYWALLQTVPHDLALLGALGNDPARFAAIHSPTLLIGGGASPAFLAEAIRALAAAIPGARSVEIPGQGHNAPDMTGPAEVAREILLFEPVSAPRSRVSEAPAASDPRG
jgi:pimeloyl-ACP methyl ester carboxylesterase